RLGLATTLVGARRCRDARDALHENLRWLERQQPGTGSGADRDTLAYLRRTTLTTLAMVEQQLERWSDSAAHLPGAMTLADPVESQAGVTAPSDYAQLAAALLGTGDSAAAEAEMARTTALRETMPKLAADAELYFAGAAHTQHRDHIGAPHAELAV